MGRVVPRWRAARQTGVCQTRGALGIARSAGIRPPRRASLHFFLSLAVTLGASALAFAEDAPQPTQGQTPAKSQPRQPAGMVRYAKPILHNGKIVLWHGAWRDGARGAAAHGQPLSNGQAGAKAGGLTILVDSADPNALRAANELAGVLGGDDGEAKPILGRTSRAALAKAVGADSVDFALAPLDGLIDATQSGADWRRRAPYVARLYNEEIELIAPRELGDIRQLAGRKVNVDAADSATANTAGIIFSRLKVAANWTNYPLKDALQQLAQGQIDAIVTVGGRSSDELSAFGGDGRFHIVSIPFTPSLSAYYAPSQLTAADQPKLIGPDEKVDTLSVPIALVAIDGATPGRVQRLAPPAGRFFANFDHLLDGSKDARWREVNLAATIGQLPRFGAAQAWLDQNKGEASADLEAFRAMAQAASASSDGPSGADSDRLYQSLMRLSGVGR